MAQYLYHATMRANLDSIMTHGLLVSKADAAAKIKGVWLHSASNSAWACLHVQKKHQATLEDVIVLKVKIARTALRRFQTGIYYSLQDIAVLRIGDVIPATEYAKGVSE